MLIKKACFADFLRKGFYKHTTLIRSHKIRMQVSPQGLISLRRRFLILGKFVNFHYRLDGVLPLDFLTVEVGTHRKN